MTLQGQGQKARFGHKPLRSNGKIDRMQIIPVLKSPLPKRDSVSAAPSEAWVRLGRTQDRINNLKMFF